jgi:trimethylguanosine synthase
VRRQIAEHVASSVPKEKCILIDAFAGAGGNTIAFAKSGKWRRVYAIEKDPSILECARHNAEIYGVQDRITWFEGDCFEIVKNQLKDVGDYSVIFASPPWGGPYVKLGSKMGMLTCNRAWLSIRRSFQPLHNAAIPSERHS